MELTTHEKRFLESRTRLIGAWRYVGPGLVVVVLGLGVWLVWSVPMLANPFAVVARLTDDSIPASTMALATALLPVVVLMCLLLALAVLVLVFAALANERRYLAILKRSAAMSPTDRLPAYPGRSTRQKPD